MNKKLQALGRLPTGRMNNLEFDYSKKLELGKIAGDVLWYAFESMKFRLADNTYYTPDFIVMRGDRTLEVHEVKGHARIFQDDAKVKIKVAASMMPIFKFKVVIPIPKNKGGGWDVIEY